ncbi:L-ascorbate metabolism protein UlaG, beta-lactamase superfamily [Lachnospiraceae bacterium NE2001]|nr:L-ascorbate metabolism protein UlaG, beta-lactamase superfamily [Lachnospiraceae bacterium NE2001]
MDVSFITVNAQNSVRIDAGEKIIYVDPFQIEKKTSDADYIFITHDHYDHFSIDDIFKIVKADTIFVVPQSMEKKVGKKLSTDKVYPVEPGKTYEVEGIAFETVAMYNKLKPFHLKNAGWCGYILDIAGKRVYIAGDIDEIDEAKNAKCDVAMIPIGGFYTMDYKDAAQLINAMKPEVAIPTHYGTAVGKPSDGEDFAELVDDSIQVELKLTF